MISIPAPTAVLVMILLLTIGILVGAILHVRRKSSRLSVKLATAHLRQQEVERELTQRSALDSLKDEFVSTVSHELRTPLTSIRGALGLLSSGVFGNLDAKSKNLLRIALTNTDRLIRLINDLLDLERMDSGVAILQMKRCSLNDMVGQATETMTALADAAQVRLVIAPAAKAILPSIYFDADPDRMLQVLTNLLSNAIKFSPAGSSVTIEIETPPDELIFRVVDQGRGIPEDQLESVFEKFQQVSHPDAKAIGGTGLGLAICRSIVQQHGGSVWAKRNVALGATICVRLPRQQRTHDAATTSPAVPIESAAVPKTERPIPGEARAAKPDVTPRQILVCEPNDAARSHFAAHLRAGGHIVYEASTSQMAIEAVQSGPLTCPEGGSLQAIVVPLPEPEVGNWDVLSQLLQSLVTASLPIACLSVGTEADALYVGRGRQTLLTDDRLLAKLSVILESERGPGRILLVEDNLDFANVVLGGFAGTTALIEHAATLHRARLLCQERKPELVLLDLALPDSGGLALIKWMRRRPELQTLPLILFCGRSLAVENESALRLSPTSFFSKARIPESDLHELVLALGSSGHAPAEQSRLADRMAGGPT